jgi:hypothetical protein
MRAVAGGTAGSGEGALEFMLADFMFADKADQPASSV